ncbi:hypothetical protein Q5424_28475 [Conexibacter sp. JD483]|uniref:hypothetical protein n=1 Tax=unclassified Conexibacter TaxID=2627773 RepID=UPI00271CCF8E|nr:MULTISPECIES: hypothetical protein [unclassified Conexibacter]MDO8189574.1 hypothetical protein [Conexibacter sp. CPCC 205706]MDO8202126.1 hypothetical protein [Conexibacter sp. CPCC 205762]MDR9373067.1 hypothetical protein [Conexibacter sp. JD483]
MFRLAAAFATALALCAALAASAAAHQGDARYRSIVRGVDPAVSGLRVQVLNYDDRFELDNRTGETVTIYGYNREPYARVDADGTVSTNRNSTAYYLNDERYANVPVPERVRNDPRAAPDWEVQDRTGRFEWHDHRMHWMVSGQVAPQVRDQSVRTKVFDYAVPIDVGGRRAAIAGTLWWVGEQGGSSFPVAAAVAFAVVVLALGAAVVIVRRRRAQPAERMESDAW